MYKSEIIRTSIENMNKIELTALKDVTDCEMLEGVANSNEGKGDVIYPVDYAVIHVENDKSSSKEYDVLVIVDASGTKYRTGSASFMKAFEDIFNELKDETTPWGIRVFGKDSKNFNGKKFLTCSVYIPR